MGREGRAKRKRTPQREARDLGAAARPGMGCKRCPLQRRVARQKKKLILERGCILGFLEGEVQIDIVVSKKRPQGGPPTASPAQRVAVGKEEQSGFCSDVSLRYKYRCPLQTRAKRQNKKTEPGTRLASRLGLVRVTGLEPAREAHQNLNLARLPIPPYPRKDG